MPRSPSRDVVDRYAGNRGYFHRADSLRRWKNRVALAAIGLTLGWLVVEFALPSRAASAHSHGELANPHAAFDANCQACHAGHSPGDFFSNPLSVFGTHSRWHDLTCTKCHAGPVHHAAAKDQSFHNQCSNCHHDHQGRGFSLVQMDDSHCTKCHEDLPAAHEKSQTFFAKTITGFAKDHPEFRSLQVSRALKFSHALHMTPGLVYDRNDRHKWTAESLEKQFNKEARSRYAPESGAADLIQLTCASCHQLDAGRPSGDDSTARAVWEQQMNAIRGAPQRSILPSRAEGAYYLPVNFDVHCKACHPLRTPAAVSGSIAIEPFFVPHRRQPDRLRPLLRGDYAARLATGKNPAVHAPLGPGGRLDPRSNPEVATFGTELDRLADHAIKALTQNLSPPSAIGTATGGFACGKCHFADGPGQSAVLPLPNKAVWLEHAAFNHVSHRSLTCASCHPGTEGAFAPDGAVNEREPVLIAGVKSCQACHAPAPNGAGIRHGCTDCHRYHNGDRPLQGLGSPWRDPKDPLSLDEFLRGKKDQP